MKDPKELLKQKAEKEMKPDKNIESGAKGRLHKALKQRMTDVEKEPSVKIMIEINKE